MNKKILSFFLFYCSTQINAQELVLLQNYKYRITKYKYINGGLFGNAYKLNDYNTTPLLKNNNRNVNANGEFGFITITNRKYESLNTYLGSGFNTSKSKSGTNSNNGNTFSINASINYNQQWYKNNMFLQINTSGTLSSTNGTTKNDIQYGKSNYTNPQINIDIGAGIGRLENITDMQNAIWLARNLSKGGMLTNELSKDEIIGLAKAITSANNYRILDGRRRRKFILKKIDIYLQSKNLIKTTDINYFNTLNDILFFANNAQRISGTKKYFTFQSGLISSKYETENNHTTINFNTQKTFSKNLAAIIGMEHYKPLNLKNQIDYGISIQGNKTNTDYMDKLFVNNILINENNVTQKMISLGLNYFIHYGYYPNTRTVINVGIDGVHGKEGENTLAKPYHQLIFGTKVDYFINYNVRAFIHLNEQYYYSIYDRFNNSENKKLFFSFNTGINISF